MVAVPGHADPGSPVDGGVLGQLRMPPAFAASLKSVLQPGATILVTEAPLTAQTTGKSQMVIASQ
jgi:hypothetical protein